MQNVQKGKEYSENSYSSFRVLVTNQTQNSAAQYPKPARMRQNLDNESSPGKGRNAPKEKGTNSQSKIAHDVEKADSSRLACAGKIKKPTVDPKSNITKKGGNGSIIHTKRAYEFEEGQSCRIAPCDIAQKRATGPKSRTTKKTSYDSIVHRKTTHDAEGATSSRIASDGRISKPATDPKASAPRNTDSGLSPYSRTLTPPRRSKNANLSSKSLGSQKSLKSVNDLDSSHKYQSSKTTLSKAEGPASIVQSAAPQDDVSGRTGISESQAKGYKRTYATIDETRISVIPPKGKPGEHLALLTRAVWGRYEYRDDKSPKMVGLRHHMKDSKFAPYFEAEDKWAKSFGWMLLSTKDITGIIYGYKRFVIVHDGKTLFLAFREYDDAKTLLEAINPSENKSIMYHEGESVFPISPREMKVSKLTANSHHFDDVWPNHSLRSRKSFQEFHEEMLEMAKHRPQHAFSFYNL
jgi:hypothetical protein